MESIRSMECYSTSTEYTYLIGALATAFPFLFLSSLGSASRGVHHNIIGLKVLDEMAKSSESAL